MKPPRTLPPLVDVLVSRLPRRAASGLGAGLGELARWTDPRGRSAARAAIAACLPELPRRRIELLVRRAYRHQGRVRCHRPALRRQGAVRFCRGLEIVGWERLEKAARRGRGIVFLGAPLGNPEVAALALSLYQELGSQPSEAELESAGRVLLELEPATGADAVEAPFFHGRLAVAAAPARLSLASGAPAVPALAHLRGGGLYRLELGDPIAPGEGGSEAALAKRHLEILEREIRARPEQWPWTRAAWRPR